MNALKKLLPSLGFKPITGAVFACRGGNLVHAVIISKDRYGCDVVSLLVCLPSFFEHGAPIARDNLQSPLAGDISPRGVVSTWAWEKGTLDIPFAVDMIKSFFKEFAIPADVRRALDDLYVSPYFEELMPLDVPVSGNMAELPSATYDIAGGALSLNEARETARALLRAALVPLGFTMPEGADVVAVRPRGDMFDCVGAVMDAFGTFVTLTCFPWTPAIWRADENWKETFYPMVSYDVMKDGVPFVLPRRRLVDMDPASLRAFFEDGIRSSSEITNHLEFADMLGSSFATMAAKLRGLPL
ncbi:MAG: hypothetical protein V4631_18065 [Pseudomonadota bacterium]